MATSILFDNFSIVLFLSAMRIHGIIFQCTVYIRGQIRVMYTFEGWNHREGPSDKVRSLVS